MKIDSDLILNVIIALFLYNAILKAVGETILKYFIRNEFVKNEIRETFIEKLNQKQKSCNSNQKTTTQNNTTDSKH